MDEKLTALRAAEHPPASVRAYTPRQIAAFQELASERTRREAADVMFTEFQAARGDVKDLRKLMKEWTT